jgi:hypothetical protein
LSEKNHSAWYVMTLINNQIEPCINITWIYVFVCVWKFRHKGRKVSK